MLKAKETKEFKTQIQEDLKTFEDLTQKEKAELLKKVAIKLGLVKES